MSFEYPNNLEKEFLDSISNLPLETGFTEKIEDILRKIGQTRAMDIGISLLTNTDEKKRAKGMDVVMSVDPEKNVDLILPLLDEVNPLIRWQAVFEITRTNRFLEHNDFVVARIIRVLREDTSPMVRIEAAGMLGYCEITPEVISALEYAREHDFESYDGYRTSRIAEDSLKRIRERQNNEQGRKGG